MTKTQISSLVLFLLAAVSAFATTTEIGSARNLVRLTKCAKTDTVLITRDIDLKGESFSPLCEDGFKGVFDGQGHTISNLTISQNIYFTNNVAFIAKLDGGVLRNIFFDKPDISTYELTDWNLFSASGVSVAVAVGELNGGFVENVHVVDGTVTINGRKRGDAIDAGGIVGTATSGTISESGGDIDVTNKGKGSVNVGGICGNITGDVTLTGVSYEGNASSLVGAGGNNVTIVSKYGAVTITEKGSTRSAVVDGSSLETFEIPEDIEVTTVQLERTFEIGKNSTIVLPFDITVAKTSGGNFNILSSISDDFKTVTLGQKTEQLHAYEPYVVLADKPTLTFEGPVTLKKTVVNDTQIPNSDWYFKAAYEKIVFGEREDLYGRAYGFAGAAVDGFTVGQFVKAGKKAWVGPMKAYLVYTGELNSSATKSAVGAGLAGELPDEINVVVQDEQGNIVERGVMNTGTGEFRMDRWYDLQGRRLKGEPKTQGTYYHNGSRVIVK